MGVTAEDIKRLREETQAGMLDCKKALAETNGDYKAAVDYLRKKGLAAVANRSGRVAAEGAIVISCTETKGAMLEINSETDFVARNEEFQVLTGQIADALCAAQKPLEQAWDLKIPTGETVQETITNLAARIKENINIRRARLISVEKGIVAFYMHNAIGPKHSKIGVMVAIESALPDKTKLYDLGKKIAMHIAAAKPKSLTSTDLEAQLIENERAIYREQAKASGKPAEFIEKMVEGRVRKFYEEVVLMEQEFVLEQKVKVREFIEREAKLHNTDLIIHDFAFFIVGEGIEKEVKDFAKEVQEQLRK